MFFNRNSVLNTANLCKKIPKVKLLHPSASCNFVSIKSDTKMIQVTLQTKTKSIDSKENVVAFLNSVTVKEIAHCHMSLIERTHFKACYARQTFVKK